MISLAKPEVVSERLETLLKVGLGRFGKVNVYSKEATRFPGLIR